MQAITQIWNTSVIATNGGINVTVGDITLVLILLLAGYLLSRLVEFLLARKLAHTELRADAVDIIKRVSFYAIMILVGITTLSLLGIPITAFAFATGAIAIGVGFGAQNIINNFISGWILIAERPIRLGDFIEIDGNLGVVEHVGTRSTRIRRVDGVHLLVPNSKLLENTVTNWTLEDQYTRTSVRVGVAYGSEIERVRELFLQAVLEQPEVIEKPKPEIVFDDFGDNALIFEALLWCDVLGEKPLRQVRSEIRFRLHALLKDAEIVVAFPQRDIHLYTQTPLAIKLDRETDR
ncbi:mechanosensitive ion channel protein [Arenicella chitinivorans]|uniref:Mechanosensitive ion channel protein n=1 Tax=Arenicella chitinivorans TaxID=1329800 RepID=A0A918RJ07_9GAMM|nr:mechanosensitive ion channel domain-containing protein [Arenicella chitinivorans]GGZ98115.1 mechanosensitive ion channel protein [Arenicella chitinivorans]